MTTEARKRLGVGLVVGALIGMLAGDLDLPSLVSYWGDRSLLVPGAAMLSALLWLTPVRRLLAAALLALAVLWLVVAYSPLVAWMSEGLVRRDTVRPADMVFVFASRLQADGEPTMDSMSRLLQGVALVSEGRARRLVVSELPAPSARYAAVAREWAGRFAPQAEVLSVGPVWRSRDEAIAVARLCRERGFSSVIAVTSPVHTRRASAVLEKQGLQVVSVPAIETRYDLETLDLPGDRRRAFGSIVHEWLGLVVYRRRGWI